MHSVVPQHARLYLALSSRLLNQNVMPRPTLFFSALLILMCPFAWGQSWVPQHAVHPDTPTLTGGGEIELLWYLPDVLGSAPAMQSTEAPEGYSLAESQSCVAQIVAYDPFCLQQHWDELCQEEYGCCQDQNDMFRIGCDNDNACNFDPTVCVDDPASCVFCVENCYTLAFVQGEGEVGYNVVWSLSNSEGQTVDEGSIDEEHNMVIAGCLDDGCYSLHVEDADGLSSVQWTLTGSDEGLLTGNAGESVGLSFDGEVGCTSPWACNFNPDACSDDGSCEFEENAPTDMTLLDWVLTYDFGCDGDDASVQLTFSDDFVATDSLGLEAQWSVCDDLVQLLFDGELAYTGLWDGTGFEGDIQSDLGGCFTLTPLLLGCTDPEACNFDVDAAADNGACTYPGCMNPLSCNYDATAGCPAPCALPEGYLEGCTNAASSNYNALATVDDGSCDLSYMCLEGTVYDSELQRCVPTSCPGDMDYDGEIDVNDLLSFLVVYDSSCD